MLKYKSFRVSHFITMSANDTIPFPTPTMAEFVSIMRAPIVEDDKDDCGPVNGCQYSFQDGEHGGKKCGKPIDKKDFPYCYSCFGLAPIIEDDRDDFGPINGCQYTYIHGRNMGKKCGKPICSTENQYCFYCIRKLVVQESIAAINK